MHDEKLILGTGKTSIHVAWQTQTASPEGSHKCLSTEGLAFRGRNVWSFLH